MYKIALLLLLTACGSAPTRHELRQSAFRAPPRAPTFSPVEDAPHTVGQPGRVAPAPERSPHVRTLPQTPATMREPGLWAGDGPRAMASGVPEIAGVPIVLPGFESPAEKSCAEAVTERLKEFSYLERLTNTAEPWRTCIVARLYAACVESNETASRAMYDYDVWRRTRDKRRRPVILPYKKSDRQVNAERAANQWMEEKCRPPANNGGWDITSKIRDAMLSAARDVR